MKLRVKAFALTSGLVAGAGLFVLTWWMIIAHGGGDGQSTVIGAVYKGYNLSPTGSLIGFVWAFVTGLFFGGLFSLIYNAFASSPDDN